MGEGRSSGSSRVEAQHEVSWIDDRREPRGAPDPAYPDGLDVDMSQGAERSCLVPLPYPARRCGYYVVECRRCGLRVGLTTAGRPDDPRSLRMACKELAG